MNRFRGQPATSEDLEKARDRVFDTIAQLKTGVAGVKAPEDAASVTAYAEAVEAAVAEWTADILEILGTF